MNNCKYTCKFVYVLLYVTCIHVICCTYAYVGNLNAETHDNTLNYYYYVINILYFIHSREFVRNFAVDNNDYSDGNSYNNMNYTRNTLCASSTSHTENGVLYYIIIFSSDRCDTMMSPVNTVVSRLRESVKHCEFNVPPTCRVHTLTSGPSTCRD